VADGSSCDELPRLEEMRVVASDMDGTFLNAKGEAPAENLRALQEAEDVGLKVVMATGRSRWSAQQRLPDLDLSTRPGVYLNGGLVYGNSGSVIHERTVPRDVVADVLRFVKDRENRRELVGLTLCYGDTMVAPSVAEPWCLHLHRMYNDPLPGDLGGYDAAVAEFSECRIEDTPPASKRLRRPEPHNIHILASSSDIDEIREPLTKLCANRVQVLKVLPTCITLMHLSCSKADGLAPVIKELGFSFQEALALGDAENDIQMCLSVGVGVAMGNAVAKLKEKVKWHCAANSADPPGVSTVLREVVRCRQQRSCDDKTEKSR